MMRPHDHWLLDEILLYAIICPCERLYFSYPLCHSCYGIGGCGCGGREPHQADINPCPLSRLCEPAMSFAELWGGTSTLQTFIICCSHAFLIAWLMPHASSYGSQERREDQADAVTLLRLSMDGLKLGMPICLSQGRIKGLGRSASGLLAHQQGEACLTRLLAQMVFDVLMHEQWDMMRLKLLSPDDVKDD